MEILLIIIESGVIIILGISLVVFVSSYKNLLADFYLLKEGIERERFRRRKVEKVEKIFGENVKKEIAKAGEAARKEISGAALAELEVFKNTLSLKTLATYEAVERAVAREFDKAKAEIDAFKAQKMSEITNKAAAATADIVKQTLGKVIGPKEQEELVLKALEDAKRQNLL